MKFINWLKSIPKKCWLHCGWSLFLLSSCLASETGKCPYEEEK